MLMMRSFLLMEEMQGFMMVKAEEEVFELGWREWWSMKTFNCIKSQSLSWWELESEATHEWVCMESRSCVAREIGRLAEKPPTHVRAMSHAHAWQATEERTSAEFGHTCVCIELRSCVACQLLSFFSFLSWYLGFSELRLGALFLDSFLVFCSRFLFLWLCRV